MEVKFDPVITDINGIHSGKTDYLVFQYLLPDLKKAFADHASGDLIDIGCGNRPYEWIIKPYITSYKAVDFTQNKLNSVDIICDAAQVPLPDQSFDTCISTQVLEHVKDPNAVIAEACRLLKPGGKLIFSVPLYWPVHGEPWDFHRFTRFGIAELINKNGLRLISLTENGGSWATAGQALANAFSSSTRRSIFFRSIRFFYYRLGMIRLTNRLFRWMDKKDFHPEGTMNYVVVAEKK
ncbi:MAG: class I SAM-dependent methyltransferase [Chitinophagaceae bacterium]|nr:class I SAM-dependent methyltransferase [Chitinophagaceae bacterium]